MRTNGRPSVATEDGMEVRDGEFVDTPSGRGGGSSAPLATVKPQSAMKVETQYTTAMVVPVPRDPEKVMAAVVREAALAGESFMYSWTQGSGDKRAIVEGVSIEGAMILARNWGNNCPEIQIVEDAPTYWLFRATFIDLETGSTLPRLFRQSKGQVSGRFDAERKLDIAMQIGMSKAQRNVIVRAMPTYLVSAAIRASKEAAAKKIADLPKAIAEALGSFKTKFNVSEAELESFVGVPKEQWNANDIVRLRATFRALVDRQTTVDQEFPKTPGDSAEASPPIYRPQQPIPETPPTGMPPGAGGHSLGEPAAEPPNRMPVPEQPATPTPNAIPSPDAQQHKQKAKREEGS